LAERACLAALRSAAACVSGIVLEAGVQKQQGAEDKQAIRDSLNTATVASAVEGCEDPRSNRGDKPPPVPAGAGICQPHAAPRHATDYQQQAVYTTGLATATFKHPALT